MIHKNYTMMNEAELHLIDTTLGNFMFGLRNMGLAANGNDPCEILAEAMATYILKSQELAKNHSLVTA